MDEIINQLYSTISNHGLINAGSVVYAAVSGGADSMAMLHALSALRREFGFELKAVHFEHGLRGEESRQNARHVSRYCYEHSIELVTGYGHMGNNNNDAASGVEAQARKLRYDFFDSLVIDDTVRIATAHTQNDVVETVLFNIMRGCGQKGAAGIPVKRGPYIRPMLEVSRDEVETYCRQHGIAYVDDKTNDELKYSRNVIRKLILPVMNSVHPGAFDNVIRFSDNMRALDEWIDAQAAALAQSAEIADGRWGYAKEFVLERLHSAARPVLMAFFSMLCGQNIHQSKLNELCDIVYRQAGKTQISNDRCVAVISQRLVLGQVAEDDLANPNLKNIHLLQEGTYRYSGNHCFTVMLADAGANTVDADENLGKGLIFTADYDKINNYSVFRVRQPGDWLRLQRRGITKQLRKWMNEQHIPAHLRDRLPVLANGDEILWVYGKGFSDSVLPDEATRQVLTIVECGNRK